MNPVDKLFDNKDEFSLQQVWTHINVVESNLPQTLPFSSVTAINVLADLINDDANAKSAKTEIYRQLIQILQSPDSVDHLLKQLNNGGPTRLIAVVLLGWLGSQSKAALPELFGIASTNSWSPKVAHIAAIRVGFSPEELLKVIKSYLQLGDEGELLQLGNLMIEAGYGNDSAFLELLSTLKSSNSPSLCEVAQDLLEKTSSQ